jgi:hypothetical protein
MKTIVDEGTWFAVPLRSKGFAAGVIARTAPSGGVVLAYFFSSVWDHPPSLDRIRDVRPEAAIRVLRTGDLGFLEGTWPIIGRDPNWRREEWPTPRFIRRDELSQRAWIVQYSDRDPNCVESEIPTSYDTELEENDLYGSGAVEIVLTRLLS